MKNALAKIIGAALLVLATLFVVFAPKSKPAEAPKDPIRPVKSYVVKEKIPVPDMHFAGKVAFNTKRELSFKVPGRIKSIPPKNFDYMKKGDVLATLDSLDYENKLTIAQAEYDRDKLSYDRKFKAAQNNAVSPEEVSRAKAALEESKASLDIAKRNLDSTVLVAPFDCVVVDSPASVLDVVNQGDVVIIIQDMDELKVKVSVPENYVIGMNQREFDKSTNICFVTFDSRPDKQYPVHYKEMATAANEENQTYTVSFVLPAIEDLMILQGMSATVTVMGYGVKFSDPNYLPICIPGLALGAAPDGGFFVWLLEATDDPELFKAAFRKVIPGVRVNEEVCIREGLKEGDRVACSGIGVLAEGQIVTLLEEN